MNQPPSRMGCATGAECSRFEECPECACCSECCECRVCAGCGELRELLYGGDLCAGCIDDVEEEKGDES